MGIAGNNPFVFRQSRKVGWKGLTAPPEYHGGEIENCVRRFSSGDGRRRAANAGRLRRLSARGRRDSTLLFLCDGESAGLATKVASSRTISRSSSAYCSLVRLLSPCDKLPRLSERCSLPDGQSRWLSVVCSRRRRTN